MKNKKGIIQLGIIAIALAVIVVGFLAFNPFKAKVGLTEEQVNALIKSMQDKNNIQTQTANTQTQQQQTQQESQKTEVGVTEQELVNQVCSIPTARFDTIWVRQRNNKDCGFNIDNCKARVVGLLTYTGDCRISKLYIEAGIPDAKISGLLATLPPDMVTRIYVKGKPSNCDGNTHYNGAILQDVDPGEQWAFELLPENYGQEGTYPISIQAWTGCEKDKGILLRNKLGDKVERNSRVSFSNLYSIPCIGTTNCVGNSYIELK